MFSILYASLSSPNLVFAIASIIFGLIKFGFIDIDFSEYLTASSNLPCNNLTSARPVKVRASILSSEVNKLSL